MKPRIPLAPEVAAQPVLPSIADMAPMLSAARQHLRQTAFRMRSVDAVTTELVRIRNARFQHCFF
jgi:hypothetical protein